MFWQPMNPCQTSGADPLSLLRINTQRWHLIPFRCDDERKLALDYAKNLDDAAAVAILEAGVIGSADQARIVGHFFWRMVDASVDENVNVEMEHLYIAFSAACYTAGFIDIWHSAMPDD
jgi:hypothetical protein